jgi:hypothetical protein
MQSHRGPRSRDCEPRLSAAVEQSINGVAGTYAKLLVLPGAIFIVTFRKQSFSIGCSIGSVMLGRNDNRAANKCSGWHR